MYQWTFEPVEVCRLAVGRLSSNKGYVVLVVYDRLETDKCTEYLARGDRDYSLRKQGPETKKQK